MTILFLALWLQMSAQTQTFKVTDARPNDHGSVVSTQIACIKTYADGFIEYNPCEISTEPPTTNFVKPVSNDIKFAEAAQRAADETDGKPGAHIYSVEELEAQGWKKSEISVCKYQVFADKRVELDGPDCPASVVREAMHPADPVDVPAVQYEIPAPHPCNLPTANGSDCFTGPETHWKCLDTSRVLLTSENGKKHCIKF